MPFQELSHSPLPNGLYEKIVSCWVEEQLEALPESLVARLEDVPRSELPAVLMRYLSGALQAALAQIEESTAPRHTSEGETQVLSAVSNALLRLVERQTGGPVREDWALPPKLKVLKEIRPRWTAELERPETSLAEHALFTGTRTEPTPVSQLQREIQSADQIEILCPVLQWSGLRLLFPDLQAFLARPNARLRLLTTTFGGTTEAAAVQCLAELDGVEVRVSHNENRSRLRSRAHLFIRNSGFHTAYMGAANLSGPALTDGLEWNMKVAAHESPHLWHKLSATFQTLWHDPEFEPYDAFDTAIHQKLVRALRRAARKDNHPYLEFHCAPAPYPFQQAALDRLEAGRALGHKARQLVVAPTGTGKTLLAAWDYRNFSAQSAEGPQAPASASAASSLATQRPSLLYVAQRQETLEQARHAFRGVLQDPAFGELMVGGRPSEHGRHLFATLQSAVAGLREEVQEGHFQYVVLDGLSAAGEPLFKALQREVPDSLCLGLTSSPPATLPPDALALFGPAASAALPLPEAIERGLLCPFQYFGMADSEDYSRLAWENGAYPTAALNNLLTGNFFRTNLILEKTRQILMDTHNTRALGFCVTAEHAEFMASRFNAAGFPAEAVTPQVPEAQKNYLQGQLKRGEIRYLFGTDAAFEGLEFPEVDTVLLLWPTCNADLFLQQLARGLRRQPGKECLTVLDFVGAAHGAFRFDLRLQALQSRGGISLERQILTGFPYLPTGCSVNLDKAAQQHVLKNVKSAVPQSAAGLLSSLKEHHRQLERQPSLEEFLEHNGLESDDIYRRNLSFTRLLVRAGMAPEFSDPDESRYLRGLRRLQHMDDTLWLPLLAAHISGHSPLDLENTQHARRLLMLHFSLWTPADTHADPAVNDARLRANRGLCRELEQLIAYKLASAPAAPQTWHARAPIPLQLHAHYTRDEILAALGHWTWKNQPAQRETALALKEGNLDAFFVTLDKAPGQYSPATMYQDFALSPTLFRWQSQSTVSAGSPTGQRYIHGGKAGHQFLLFVREAKEKNNLAQPYAFLGPASYQSHSGERPMSVVWKLEHPIPAHLLGMAARLGA